MTESEVSSVCVMAHRTVVVEGESPVWLRADEGGRPVAGAQEGALLCRGHRRLLLDTIAATPSVVVWIREHVPPTGSAPDRSAGWTRAGGRVPPAPLSVAAIDAADEEVATVAAIAGLVADELGVRGPSLAGTRRVLVSRHTTDGERRVDGVRPLEVADVAGTVDEICRWLLARTDWLVGQGWIGETMTEVVEARRTHLARWPLKDRDRRLRGFRCLECDRESIIVHPPAKPPQWLEPPTASSPGRVGWAWPMLVACSDQRCGAVVPERYWAWAAELASSGRTIRAEEVTA